MAIRIVAVALGLGTFTLACVPARYRPTVPMRARSADLQLELVQLAAGSGQELTFQSRSTAPHALRNAWFTVATRAPCEDGQEVARITIDGQAGSELSPGTHEIRLKFEGAPQDVALDLVVDVGLDDDGCVRAPAISQSLAMAAPNRFILVASNGLSGGEDLRGFRAMYGARIGGGGWLGRVLLTAEAGVGAAFCNAETCGRNSNNNLRSHVTFPVAGGVRYAFTPTMTNALFGMWMIGAEYGYLPVTLPAMTGERRFGLHTAHLTPGWATFFFNAGKGPFVEAHRIPLTEIYFPVGIAIDPGGRSQKVGLSGGLALRMLLPM